MAQVKQRKLNLPKIIDIAFQTVHLALSEEGGWLAAYIGCFSCVSCGFSFKIFIATQIPQPRIHVPVCMTLVVNGWPISFRYIHEVRLGNIFREL